jgi:chemotaxis protein MotB
MNEPATKGESDLEFESDDKIRETRDYLRSIPLEELDEYHLYKSQSLRAKNEESESNWLVSYADMMTLLVGFFIMLQSFSKVDATQFEQVKKAATKVFGGEYKIPFESLTSKLKSVVEKQKLTDQVLFHQTDEGLEITFRGALFFDSGSANLKTEATTLLNSLIPAISENAKTFGIVVEGHTDNRPVNGGIFASNWELSSVRACSVLRLFEQKGFDPNRLKALGWGERRPIVPNEDDKNSPLPENQAQNRRVVIKILRNFEAK